MDRYLLQHHRGAPLPFKTIYLVRHGESLHNAQVYSSYGADSNDARYIDSPLTMLGENQAHTIAPQIASINPQLIVTSPMTRATQTCLLATKLIQHIPILVNSKCTERLAFSCDIGSPVSILQHRFPMLDYSNIYPPDSWWWSPISNGSVQHSYNCLRMNSPGSRRQMEPYPHLQKRINDFRIWLLSRPETRIVVFAHGIFLKAFLGSSHANFANCEIKKVIL